MFKVFRPLVCIGIITTCVYTSSEFSRSGNVRVLGHRESGAVWGAGSDCSVDTFLGTTNGCETSPCSAHLNVRAEGEGTAKIVTKECTHGGTRCGDVTVSNSCN